MIGGGRICIEIKKILPLYVAYMYYIYILYILRKSYHFTLHAPQKMEKEERERKKTGSNFQKKGREVKKNFEIFSISKWLKGSLLPIF